MDGELGCSEGGGLKTRGAGRLWSPPWSGTGPQGGAEVRAGVGRAPAWVLCSPAGAHPATPTGACGEGSCGRLDVAAGGACAGGGGRGAVVSSGEAGGRRTRDSRKRRRNTTDTEDVDWDEGRRGFMTNSGLQPSPPRAEGRELDAGVSGGAVAEPLTPSCDPDALEHRWGLCAASGGTSRPGTHGPQGGSTVRAPDPVCLHCPQGSQLGRPVAAHVCVSTHRKASPACGAVSGLWTERPACPGRPRACVMALEWRAQRCPCSVPEGLLGEPTF